MATVNVFFIFSLMATFNFRPSMTFCLFLAYIACHTKLLKTIFYLVFSYFQYVYRVEILHGTIKIVIEKVLRWIL